MNKMTLKSFFKAEKIEEYAILDFKDVSVVDERRAKSLFKEETPVTVIPFLIPYKTPLKEELNISRYAVSKDYHLYFKQLSERLSSAFPSLFFSSCDTSPINEVEAAVKAGLGSIGRHGLLINKHYGSYVFIGEFFTSLPSSHTILEGIEKRIKGQNCLECGACERICPTGAVRDKTRCVSLINQKKKLDEGDEEIIRSTGIAWGCDVCQSVCPLNHRAEDSEIPFFKESLISLLDRKALEELINNGDFPSRAYSWRGENTIKRNIEIIFGEGK